MDDYQRQAAHIKARIAALRSSIAGGLESYKAPQAQRVQYTTERPTETARVHPRPETDWDAIAKLTAENDAKEAKAAEMDAMKAKLRGNKPQEQIIEPSVATEPPKIEPDWDAIARLKAKNDEMAAMRSSLQGKKR